MLGQLVNSSEQLREEANRFQSVGVEVFDLGGATGLGHPWEPGSMPPMGSLILVDGDRMGKEATEAAKRNRAAGVGLIVLKRDGAATAELQANLGLIG